MRILLVFNAAPPTTPLLELEAISDRAVEDVARSVTRVLSDHGHQVTSLAIGSSPRDLLAGLDAVQPHVVFNLCETICGQSRLEPALPMILTWLGIPYTGNSPHTLALLLDKPSFKAVCRAEGLPTPEFIAAFHENDLEGFSEWPAILKPAGEDASLGIDEHSIVAGIDAARPLFRKLRDQFGTPVLVERFISGRELNIAALQSGDTWNLGVNEIDYSSLPPHLPGIVTYAAKWLPDSVYYQHTPVRAPAVISPALRERLETLTRRLITRWELSGVFRVDVRVDAEERVFLLEVNPNPDLSEDAGFAKALPEIGCTYDQAVLSLIDSALARTARAAKRK
jgi:D-alanine-D-alanine ligase